MVERPAPNALPTAEQRLLLNAAFFSEEPAVKSWEEWIRRNHLDSLDQSCARILPLIYLNIGRHLKEPVLSRIKGVYRKNFYSNHFLLQSIKPALQRFLESGIPVMLIKGTPLLLRFYKNFGARLIRDIDILVPEEKRDAAALLLKEQGWHFIESDMKRRPELIAGHWRRFHSINFCRGTAEHLDLHWFMLELDLRRGTDNGVWQRAGAFQLGGLDVVSPCDTDLVIHVLAHGCNYARSWPSVQATADLLTIFRRSSAVIDWDLLTEEFLRRKISLVAKAWFNFLVRHYEVPVPERVLSKLRQVRPFRLERLRFNSQFHPRGSARNVAYGPPGGYLTFAAHWNRYLCQIWPAQKDRLERPFFPALLPGFWTYLQYYFKLRSPWLVPGEILRRLVRRLGRLRPRTGSGGAADALEKA